MSCTPRAYSAEKKPAKIVRSAFLGSASQMDIGNGERQNPLPGFVEVSQPGQLVELLRQRRIGGRFRIVYKPGYNAEEHFDAVCRLVLETRDTVFAVDEIWHFCKPGWLPEPLKFMVRAGRHRGVTLLYTAQFPANVSRDLTAASTQLRVFRLIEDRDIESIKGRLAKEALVQVPRLPDHHHIWRDEFSNWRQVAPQ